MVWSHLLGVSPSLLDGVLFELNHIKCTNLYFRYFCIFREECKQYSDISFLWRKTAKSRELLNSDIENREIFNSEDKIYIKDGKTHIFDVSRLSKQSSLWKHFRTAKREEKNLTIFRQTKATMTSVPPRKSVQIGCFSFILRRNAQVSDPIMGAASNIIKSARNAITVMN